MILFHLFAVPLFLLMLSGIYGSKSADFKQLRLLFLKGMLLFVPAFIIYIIFKSILSLSYRPFLLYLYGFFLDHFLYFFIVPIGLILLYGLSNLRKVDFLSLSYFYGGFYTLVSIQTILENWGQYNIYLLFYLPLLRVAAVLLAALFIVNIAYSYGWNRAGYLIALIILPFVAGCVTFFYRTCHFPFALLLTLFYVFASFALRYIVKE
jgi:hypothetical protein